jgi:signal transduction histidine kinase/CheY-like chemotaxis protein
MTREHLPGQDSPLLAMTQSQDSGNARERALWYGHAMEQLVEVVQHLSMARDLATVMDIVKHAARTLTGADGATFVLRDGDKCFYADEDAISPLWKGQRFPMDICISGWAMLNRQPAVIEDIYADPRIPADAYRPTFVKSLAMVPIRTLDPVGAIGNYWAEQHQPSPEQLKVLQALADTTAVALENIQVYAELEKRVRERTLELETILDNIQAGVFFSTHNRIVRANPKTAELFGASSPDSLVGMPIRALLQSAGNETLWEDSRLEHAPSEVFDTEIQLKRRDAQFWAHVVHKLPDPELYPDSAIWMIGDISAAKEKEDLLIQMRQAAEESTRFKSEFLASMSHELRTPLNAIIGFSEVLRDGLVGELNNKQHEYLCDIFDSGQHLLALINDVLDLSKVEAGKMLLELEKTDPIPLLGGSLSIVKEKALLHRISLKQDMPEEMAPCWVDQRKLKQIVYNLLSNAVKFTPEGGEVTLHASLVTREEALRQAGDLPEVRTPLPENVDVFLQIGVSDSGIGIEADDMARLFQPFVQIDSSLSRRFEGTGLGLALVRKLAELHGGAVQVASLPGCGSRFTVWLPYRDTPGESGRQAILVRPDAIPVETEAPRVLVVEDNNQAADLIRMQLEANGCEVMRAASAQIALSMLNEPPWPDLISLDILLPDMDGWELLARIKQNPQFAQIPIVIMSIVADCSKGLSLGAAEVLQKPVLKDDLDAALERLGLGRTDEAGEPRTILVVDDDPHAVELVTAYLRTFPFKVLGASGGAEGISMAQTHLPSLIILDLMMPEVSGFEVVEALAARPETAKIPILILTAKLLTAEDRRMLNGRVIQIMEKSDFNQRRFMTEVWRALGRRQFVPLR